MMKLRAHYIIDSGKKGKGKGKGRGKKEAGAPKGATNAFMVFSKEQREKFKAEGKKVTFAEAGKLIAERWKALSDDDKKPYQEAAEKDKKRHEKADSFKGRGGQEDDQGEDEGGHKSRSHGHRGDDRGGLRLCLHKAT